MVKRRTQRVSQDFYNMLDTLRAYQPPRRRTFPKMTEDVAHFMQARGIDLEFAKHQQRRKKRC